MKTALEFISDVQDWLLDRRWLSSGLGAIVVVTGPFVLMDFEIASKSHPTWSGLFGIAGPLLLFLFLTCATFEFWLSILRAKREPKLKSLLKARDDANAQLSEISSAVRQLFDGMLYTFGRRLDLEQHDQVRISLYVHDQNRKTFVPCGRYCPNPHLANPGRTQYPDNEGCIGKGWHQSWHFENDVPEPGTERREYEKRVYGIRKGVADAMKMQAKLYAAKRISYGEESLAVIVVEAMDRDRFTNDFLKDALDQHNDNFASMVRNLKPYIPSPSNAGDNGL